VKDIGFDVVEMENMKIIDFMLIFARFLIQRTIFLIQNSRFWYKIIHLKIAQN